ncbi:MAG: mechanosensitive ion channel family protein [bacterium]
MQELFSKTFYSNTVGDWIVAALIVLAALVFGKALYWLVGNVVKRMARKTSTRLDDIILDMVEEPIVFAITLLGIWNALQTLTISASLQEWIGRAYYVLIIFNVAWLLTRLFDALVDEYLVPLVSKTEGDLDDQLLPIVRKATKIAVWTIAVIVALNNAGYDVGALLAGLGIGGLAFALAAQDSVANLFGGFTIFTDKPFKVHDRVVVNGYDGYVREIGIRSTRIQTLDGRMVTIPNSAVANNAITNISSEPSRKIVLNLGLTYDTDPNRMQQAIDLLRQIAHENSDLIEDKFIISFNGFGDFALNIMFIYYIRKSGDIFETQTKINMQILRRFNENKLEFAFPTQTIYTLSGS